MISSLVGGKTGTKCSFPFFSVKTPSKNREWKCLDESLREKGKILWALSTVQYYQALRISEAAALFWEDVYLDLENPKNSRIKVNKAVFWPRVAKMKSFIKPGFKNDKSNGGVKEHPMFPETFKALKAIKMEKSSGLIFQWSGRHLE